MVVVQRANSTAAASPSKSEVESYMKQHDVEGLLSEAMKNLVATMPADPKAALAQFFKKQ